MCGRLSELPDALGYSGMAQMEKPKSGEVSQCVQLVGLLLMDVNK